MVSVALAPLLILASAQQVGIDGPAPVDSASAHVVVDFIDAATSGSSLSAYVTDDFEMSWMGLGGEATQAEVHELLAPCYLGALVGSQPLEAGDTSTYLWAIMVCSEDEQTMRMPIGFALRDEKIFQLEIQYATPLRSPAEAEGEAEYGR